MSPRSREEITINNQWYVQEKLAKYQHADLLQEASRARLAKLAKGDSRQEPILIRAFSWLGKLATAAEKSLTAKRHTLTTKDRSYLDHPDPFKDCVTC
jgi:hypothetical protein